VDKNASFANLPACHAQQTKLACTWAAHAHPPGVSKWYSDPAYKRCKWYNPKDHPPQVTGCFTFKDVQRIQTGMCLTFAARVSVGPGAAIWIAAVSNPNHEDTAYHIRIAETGTDVYYGGKLQTPIHVQDTNVAKLVASASQSLAAEYFVCIPGSESQGASPSGACKAGQLCVGRTDQIGHRVHANYQANVNYFAFAAGGTAATVLNIKLYSYNAYNYVLSQVGCSATLQQHCETRLMPPQCRCLRCKPHYVLQTFSGGCAMDWRLPFMQKMKKRDQEIRTKISNKNSLNKKYDGYGTPMQTNI